MHFLINLFIITYIFKNSVLNYLFINIYESHKLIYNILIKLFNKNGISIRINKTY